MHVQILPEVGDRVFIATSGAVIDGRIVTMLRLNGIPYECDVETDNGRLYPILPSQILGYCHG